MSLVDALLLEGYRDPKEIYIALRTDGLKGSGTIDDPYGGGTRLGASSVTSVSVDRKEFLLSADVEFTAGGNPPLVSGQSVVVLGATGASADLFNAEFIVTKLTEKDVKVTAASVPTEPPSLSNVIRFGVPSTAATAALSHASPLVQYMEVTITTAAPHGFSDGMVVKISGVTGSGAAWFNGAFQIHGITAAFPNILKYRLTKPGVPPAGANGQNVNVALVPVVIKARLSWPLARGTTASAHDLVSESVVRMAGASDPLFNGDFLVLSTVPGTTSFCYRLGGILSSDATHAGMTSSSVQFRFDASMRACLPNSFVRIGEGIFETRGFDLNLPQGLRWSLLTGQRIIGSGIGNTTLRLVHAVPWANAQLMHAISHSPWFQPYTPNADNVEISDLTVDCNMRSQTGGTGDRVAKAAISIWGSHARIRRVRAFDFGTHVPAIECFVLNVGNADPRTDIFTERRDSHIEDCILERPSLNGLYTNSCMIVSSGENTVTGEMAYHRGCAIRDNYVNNEYVDNPVSIASIQYQSGAWMVSTRGPHGRANGDWVVLSGAVDSSGTADTEGYSIHLNGTFQISGVSPSTPDQFQITPAGSPATSLSPAGTMWVGRFTSHRLSVKRLELVSSSPPVARLTSYVPHNKRPDDWVNVYGTSSPPPAGVGPYYGRFKVLADGMTPTVLKYQMDQVPAAACVDDTDSGCTYDLVFMGVSSVGFSSDGGSEAVTEGNRVFRTSSGGSYHDTWSTKDQTDRNNYYSDVLAGPQQSITGVDNTGATDPKQAASVTKSGTTVTFTTTNAHGLVKGHGVRITPQIGTPAKFYFAVSSVPTANSFSIEVPGVGVLTPPYTFAGMWQVGLAVREGNVVEVGQVSPLARTLGPPTAFVFYTGAYEDQFPFRKVICRGNQILLPFHSQNTLADAFVLLNIESGLIEANCIDLVESNPWNITGNNRLYIQQNLTPQGMLKQPAAGMIGDDISTRIQDALLLAL